ncbi:IDEAL domain-containing protein [Virgibacillus xinjiangensis]|uniref:IDEAL domain-containing protein n=1 Tax=Virgibacillus xinjiangensis TaxID=393090 RepID=A0ABV7CZY9_9BACI
MVTVKMLKPYYIKAEKDVVRVILAYQYFSVLIKKQVYQFIPVEAKEIRLSRKTRKVVNTDDRFAFQHGKDVVYMTLAELISLPDFQMQLNTIVEPYYRKERTASKKEKKDDTSLIIQELERQNIMRMIDKALDEHDEEAFNELVKQL